LLKLVLELSRFKHLEVVPGRELVGSGEAH